MVGISCFGVREYGVAVTFRCGVAVYALRENDGTRAGMALMRVLVLDTREGHARYVSPLCCTVYVVGWVPREFHVQERGVSIGFLTRQLVSLRD